jgi:hypothetical protein
MFALEQEFYTHGKERAWVTHFTFHCSARDFGIKAIERYGAKEQILWRNDRGFRAFRPPVLIVKRGGVPVVHVGEKEAIGKPPRVTDGRCDIRFGQ